MLQDNRSTVDPVGARIGTSRRGRFRRGGTRVAATVRDVNASHGERAEELAAQANRELEKALASSADMLDGGWANYAGTGREAADRVMWERVRALQAQAQVHATLALADTVFARGGL